MAPEEKSSSSTWTWEQDKAFETALAIYSDTGSSDNWEKIATAVTGKTVEDLKHHYEILVEDINAIESNLVPLPSYLPSLEDSAEHATDGGGKKGGTSANQTGESNNGGKSSRSDQERRRGIAWTEDEHRLFLLGLEKYGKGDWRSISRNFVLTRTPTQVASHAQKYFNRMNSMNKDRRRTSIHDITTVVDGASAAAQGPITGLTSAPAPMSRKSGKHPVQQPSIQPTVGVYGTPAVGQPIGGPFVSAIGTPVSMPVTPNLAYGMQTPVTGVVIPGAPANTSNAPYNKSHTTTKK